MEIFKKFDFVFDGRNIEKGYLEMENLFKKFDHNMETISVAFLNDFPLDENFILKIGNKELISKLSHLKIENYFKFDGLFFSRMAELQKDFSGLKFFFLNNVRIIDFEKFFDFFQEKNISNLIFLGLSNTNINDYFLSKISRKSFKNLMYLNLNSSFNLTSQGLIEFFNSSMSENLKSLLLQNLEIENEGIFALCFSPICKNLEELDLSLCSNINEVAFLNLIMSPNLKNLKKFYCFNTMITNQFFIDFGRKSKFENLTTLRLEENYSISAEGYGYIGTCSLFKNLDFLQISMSLIDNENFKKIYESPYLKKLKTLIFYDNPKVGKCFLKEFFNSSLAESLENLDLTWMDVDDNVLIALTDSKSFKNLKTLTLNNCSEISEKGFYEFFQTEFSNQLEKINFSLNKIDSDTIELIIKKCRNNVMKLKELDLRRCNSIIFDNSKIKSCFSEKKVILYIN